MENGPSPMIPFLTLIALVSVISNKLPENTQKLASFLGIIFPLFLVIGPILPQTIAITIPIALVFYLVISTMYTCPLVLVCASCFISLYVFSPPDRFSLREEEHDRGEFWTCGFGRLFAGSMFVILYYVFYQGEGYKSEILVSLVAYLVLYNLLRD